MAKKKATLEEALLDFVSSILDAAKILKEDIQNIQGAADDEDEAEEAPAPKKKSKKEEKPSKSKASKKDAVEEDDEEDEDAAEDEGDEEEDEDEAPKKKGKSEKASKKSKASDDEDDEEESEDDEDEIEYSVIQKAVVKAAKEKGRDFVAQKLKEVGGKKCDHAQKLKPEQYQEFLDALEEDAEEEDED